LRWTRKAIVAEIKRLHAEGAELNYATAEDNHLNLVRAAAWHFGTWRRAVESAGIEYDSISKYQRWNRERIISRIRELHSEGADLNWRAVSTEVDPPLAAAALRPNGFQSWRDAIRASGLDINGVARYQAWDEERVLKDIKALHRAGTAALFQSGATGQSAAVLCRAPAFRLVGRSSGCSWPFCAGHSLAAAFRTFAGGDAAEYASRNGTARTKNTTAGAAKNGAGKSAAAKSASSDNLQRAGTPRPRAARHRKPSWKNRLIVRASLPRVPLSEAAQARRDLQRHARRQPRKIPPHPRHQRR
jgi:hypothetical protein